jgi:hypothetical protein
MRWGIAILGTCLLVSGCTERAKAPSAYVPPVETVRSSEVGRYTIIHNPNGERDSELLDTVTGRSWKLIEAEGGPRWLPIRGAP